MSETGGTAIDDGALRQVHERTVERYRSRFREHGVSALALGWGSREHQRVRFEAVLRAVDPRGKTVLDYGCGFADLYGHLLEAGHRPGAYLGVDVNPEFVEVARERYPQSDHPEVDLRVNDPAAEDASSWRADIVVMLGLLNYKQPDVDNEAFARRCLELAYGWATECLVCDFLSAEPTPGYEREDWVNYYPPGRVLDWALELSPYVTLQHDYEPIPQRESLVVIRRRPVA